MRTDSRQLVHYAFVDPGSGKRKEQLKRLASKSAIVCAGIDAGGYIWVRYSWADRVSPTSLQRKMFEVHELYNTHQFGIESNAQQSLFYGVTATRAKELAKGLKLVPVDQPSGITKIFRIRTEVQLPWAEGRIIVGPGNTELISQIRTFPRDPEMDLIDALGSLIRLIPKKGTVEQTSDELEGYLAYLRDSGADMNYIRYIAENGMGGIETWDQEGPNYSMDLQ